MARDKGASMDYRLMPTSAEVYAVLRARHKDDLELFSSLTSMDDQEGNLMSTSWGFEGASVPLIACRYTWKSRDNERFDEESDYWLCVPEPGEEES